MALNSDLMRACEQGTVFDEMKMGAYSGAELVLSPQLNISWEADAQGLVLFNFSGHLYHENNFYFINIKTHGYEQSKALFLSLLQIGNALPVAWVIRLFREEAFWPILREAFRQHEFIRNHFSRPEVMTYFYQTYRRDNNTSYKRWRCFFNPIYASLFPLARFPDFDESLYFKFVDIEMAGDDLKSPDKFVKSLGIELNLKRSPLVSLNPSRGCFSPGQKINSPCWMSVADLEDCFVPLLKDILKLTQNESEAELLFYSRLAQNLHLIFQFFERRVCADQKINVAPLVAMLEQAATDHVMIHGPLLLKALAKPSNEHESILRKIFHSIMRVICFRFKKRHLVPAVINPIIIGLIRKNVDPKKLEKLKKQRNIKRDECNQTKALMVLPSGNASSTLLGIEKARATYRTEKFIHKLFMFYRGLEDRLENDPRYQMNGDRLFEDIKTIRSLVLTCIAENHPDKRPYTNEDGHWRPQYVQNLTGIRNILAEYEKYFSCYQKSSSVYSALLLRRVLKLTPKQIELLRPCINLDYTILPELRPLAKQITGIAQSNGLHHFRLGDIDYSKINYDEFYDLPCELLSESSYQIDLELRKLINERPAFMQNINRQIEEDRRAREEAERRAEEDRRLREQADRRTEEERRAREEAERRAEEDRRAQDNEIQYLRKQIRFFESQYQASVQNPSDEACASSSVSP